MRTVRIQAPEGEGAHVAALAFASGVTEVSMHRVEVSTKGSPSVPKEVVEVATSTPTARTFVDALMRQPYFDTERYAITMLHPRVIVAKDSVREETRPFPLATADVWQELWQSSHITASSVVRVFVASLLLAYGMIEHHMPLIIAGLLFLPYHRQMISIGFALVTGGWRLLWVSTLMLILGTVLIMVAGATVASLVDHPMRFMEFGTPVSGFLIALVVGIAAALASSDDAGQRELIGLAATAHLSVIPAWFGIALVDGFPPEEITHERFVSFAIGVGTLTVSAAATFAALRGIK